MLAQPARRRCNALFLRRRAANWQYLAAALGKRVAGGGLMCHDWELILATEYRVQWFLEICDLRSNK